MDSETLARIANHHLQQLLQSQSARDGDGQQSQRMASISSINGSIPDSQTFHALHHANSLPSLPLPGPSSTFPRTMNHYFAQSYAQNYQSTVALARDAQRAFNEANGYKDTSPGLSTSFKSTSPLSPSFVRANSDGSPSVGSSQPQGTNHNRQQIQDSQSTSSGGLGNNEQSSSSGSRPVRVTSRPSSDTAPPSPSPIPFLHASYSTCADFEKTVKDYTLNSGYFVHCRKRSTRSCRMVCSRYKQASYGQPGLGCPYEVVASLLPMSPNIDNNGSKDTSNEPSGLVWKITKCELVHNQACQDKNAQKADPYHPLNQSAIQKRINTKKRKQQEREKEAAEAAAEGSNSPKLGATAEPNKEPNLGSPGKSLDNNGAFPSPPLTGSTTSLDSSNAGALAIRPNFFQTYSSSSSISRPSPTLPLPSSPVFSPPTCNNFSLLTPDLQQSLHNLGGEDLLTILFPNSSPNLYPAHLPPEIPVLNELAKMMRLLQNIRNLDETTWNSKREEVAQGMRECVERLAANDSSRPRSGNGQ